MVSKCAVFIATSLDGFISREDGSIDWLNRANAAVPAGEDCGYGEFISSIDAIVLGRKTFETVLTYEKWPYQSLPVVVLSKTLKSLPANIPSSVTISQKSPTDLVGQLRLQKLERLYIDGGLTIQSFLAAGLIDEMTITVIPVLVGSGRRLFGPLSCDIRLEHLSSRAFPFGFVQNKYRLHKVD